MLGRICVISSSDPIRDLAKTQRLCLNAEYRQFLLMLIKGYP
jgi:hypothetical protein